METSNEELRAANEEIVSSNEELQSTNEEMQTAKEEIQASNEELNTLNEQQLKGARDDAEAVLGTIHVPLVVLDSELRLLAANSAFCDFFKVSLAESENRYLRDLGNRQWDIPSLAQFLAQTLDDGGTLKLVVEDEEAIRQLVVMVLGSKGYRLFQARNGADALNKIADFSGEIHLLITDVMMPGMSGQKLAETLRTTRPGVKVLFVSGHSEELVRQQGVAPDSASFVQKPFSPSALLRKVQKLLAS